MSYYTHFMEHITLRINIKKLDAMGVKFDYNEREGVITFFPKAHNEQAQKKIQNLGELLEFSDIECDELIGVVYRIQMISVLKRASGG